MSSDPLPSPSQYKAVLFDMDGVLADTHEWVVSAFTHTAHAHDFTFTPDALHPLFGQPLEACYDHLAPGGNAVLLADTHRSFQKQHPHLVTAFDQIPHVLHTLQAARIPLAIVTGRTHPSADPALDRLALRSYFSAVVCADDTPHHKPHPQPVLHALSLLSVNPADALMVGDATADILSGQRAGCHTAAALYGFVGPALAAAHPTHLLHTPSDLLQILGF